MISPENYKGSTEINTAILNLFDKSILCTVAWPLENFIEIVKKSEYEGIEWHPLKQSVAAKQLNKGFVTQEEKEVIRSLHQSFRTEKNIKDILSSQNKGFTVISFLLLEEKNKSLDTLEKLQKIIGKKLPIILYPPEFNEESGTQRDFSEKLFQPTPEIMKQWKVKTPEKLIKEASQKGYTGLCVDLFHLRKKGNISLNPWQKNLPKLLPYTKEIHIGVGRSDMEQNDIDTKSELKDLLKGTKNTEIFPMIKTIKESGWKGRIVTEIPAKSLHELRRENGQSLSVKTLIEDHKRIVENIQKSLD